MIHPIRTTWRIEKNFFQWRIFMIKRDLVHWHSDVDIVLRRLYLRFIFLFELAVKKEQLSFTEQSFKHTFHHKYNSFLKRVNQGAISKKGNTKELTLYYRYSNHEVIIRNEAQFKIIHYFYSIPFWMQHCFSSIARPKSAIQTGCWKDQGRCEIS